MENSNNSEPENNIIFKTIKLPTINKNHFSKAKHFSERRPKPHISSYDTAPKQRIESETTTILIKQFEKIKKQKEDSLSSGSNLSNNLIPEQQAKTSPDISETSTTQNGKAVSQKSSSKDKEKSTNDQAVAPSSATATTGGQKKSTTSETRKRKETSSSSNTDENIANSSKEQEDNPRPKKKQKKNNQEE